MKIALEGAMCTGKTTIGTLVAEKLGMPFIEEAARKALEAGFELDKNANLESQLWMFGFQKKEEAKCLDGFIADRGALSVAVYTSLNSLIREAPKKLILNSLKEYITEEKPYDKIIYFPPDILKMQNDEVRCIDDKFQEMLHQQYLHIFDEWKIEYYTVQTVAIPDRVKELCELIKPTS